MLHIENAIVIKETKNNKYGFLPLSKEEFESIDVDIAAYYEGLTKDKIFKEKYGISTGELLLHGDVTEVTNDLIANYIDMVTIKESEIQQFRTSYKCFCGEKHGLDYTKTILHGAVVDSWRCLLTHVGFPQYGAIINIKPYEKTI